MADYSNVLPSTAVVAGIGGVGGFLYDRYIRGNKKLEDNLKAVLVGGGIGGLVGAATSVGSAYLNSGAWSSTKKWLKDPDTVRLSNPSLIPGVAMGGLASKYYGAWNKNLPKTPETRNAELRNEYLSSDKTIQVTLDQKTRELERASRYADAQTRAEFPNYQGSSPKKGGKGGKGSNSAPKSGGIKSALNPFRKPTGGRVARFGKSLYVAALTTAATEAARQLLINNDAFQ